MELEYIYTRLQTPFSAVYLAVNETENDLEVKKPMIILDNELEREETRLDIDMKTFNLLKGLVESFKPVKNMEDNGLPDINIDKLDVISCHPIKGLEDNSSFVSILTYYEECSTKYLVALTDKIEGHELAIEIGQDVYEALSDYSK